MSMLLPDCRLQIADCRLKTQLQNENPRVQTAICNLLVLLFALTVAGCGKPRGQVSGKVFFKDQELDSGTVTFVGQDNYKAFCAIGPDNTYSFDNVPLGPVRIAFESHHRVPPGFRNGKPPPEIAQVKEEPPAAPLPIPEKYKNPEESGLTFTVTAGKQTFHIKLNP
jgi:hypothetical protein